MGVYLILQVFELVKTCHGNQAEFISKQKVNLPLQIQPQIFGFFSTIIWAQILYYDQYISLMEFKGNL